MIVYDFKQGTDEWFAARLGRMTASHAQAIAAQGKGLDTLCRKLAYERFTGVREAGYKSEAMQRGNDQENFARQAYELETGRQVTEVGFVEYSDYVGFSPDGLIVCEHRGVEFKRQNNERHGDILIGAAGFDSGYLWQCRMGMLLMGYERWDLCSYNPNFKAKSLFIQEIEQTDEAKEKLLGGFEKGEELIKQYVEQLMN